MYNNYTGSGYKPALKNNRGTFGSSNQQVNAIHKQSYVYAIVTRLHPKCHVEKHVIASQQSTNPVVGIIVKEFEHDVVIMYNDGVHERINKQDILSCCVLNITYPATYFELVRRCYAIKIMIRKHVAGDRQHDVYLSSIRCDLPDWYVKQEAKFRPNQKQIEVSQTMDNKELTQEVLRLNKIVAYLDSQVQFLSENVGGR